MTTMSFRSFVQLHGQLAAFQAQQRFALAVFTAGDWKKVSFDWDL